MTSQNKNLPIKTQSIFGFTLIELSIVLVIIGLIVGGVLVGRDLIATSRIRAQISQIDELKAATNTFRAKYGFFPGDMPPSEAAQLGFFTFTGTYAGNTTVFASYGNGDGVIGVSESIVFWSHLSDAKLIKGNYGGTNGNLLESVTTNTSPGLPITWLTSSDRDSPLFFPQGKILNDSFVSVSANFPLTPYTIFKYYTTNRINMFAVINPLIFTGTGALSANTVYQIDSKIDDGLPTSGDVREYRLSSTGIPAEHPPCTTSGASPIAYDLSPATADKPSCYGVNFLW